ncbi:MAG: hypothetical protein ACO20V_09140, partial [Alphaproteobacteria bacterium]
DKRPIPSSELVVAAANDCLSKIIPKNYVWGDVKCGLYAFDAAMQHFGFCFLVTKRNFLALIYVRKRIARSTVFGNVFCN